MILKIFRAVWFLSMVVVMADLLYTYAGLPEEVVIVDEGSSSVAVSREVVFYVMMAVIILVNSCVYLVGRMMPNSEDFRAWFHGLVITFNIFFVIGLSLLSLFNSAENFRYEQIGFIVYGSVGLVIVWAACWPLYMIFKRISSKQVV